jgi:FMN phosphatase YigB (HAD superfamily)
MSAPVRAIVFDLFDTLVDLYMEKLPRVEHRGASIPASARALHAALPRRSGVDFDTFAGVLAEVDADFQASHLSEGIELPTLTRFTAVCERLGVGDERLPGLLSDVHMSLLREQVAMPLHHIGLMSDLRQRVHLGICSNFSHSPTAYAILEDYGLDSHFDAIVISEEVGIRKPRNEIFREVLQKLDCAPEEALHVGDNLDADVAGAAAHGMRTVWITRRVRNVDDALRRHRGPHPDYRIADLGELEGVLGGLETGRIDRP